MGWLGDRLRRFGEDGRGNVAIMFGLAVIPMMIGIGAAVDYARVANVRAKLNGAADFATLAAVSKNANPFKNTPTQTQVAANFNAIATSIPNLSLGSVNVSVASSFNSLAVTLNYTGSVKTIFGSFLGMSQVALTGTSTAQATPPPYINFYMLLDNSPSMGLGATPADITALQAKTPDSCAFACHQHTYDSMGRITGDNTSDYYHVAKANNITMRIDVLRTATQQLTQTATTSATLTNQFQMGVYTFSDTFQTIAPLSSNMSSVSSATGGVDLAYAYQNGRDFQTSYDTALTYINSIIPAPGGGSSASSPREVVFMVTDGVEDEPTGASSAADTPETYSPKYTGTLPPRSQPNVSTTSNSNVTRGSMSGLITTIATSASSLCTSIKARGIQIAVLYTPYLPVTNNAFYNQYVAVSPLNNNNLVNPNDPTDPANNGVGIALKNCASPGLYYQVTPSQGISQAMQALFAATINNVQLTH